MIQQLLTAIGRVFTWFVVVAPWEQALRIRLGKHVKLLTSGWYWRFPFIDRVYRQATRRRSHYLSQQTVTTLDGKSVTFAGVVSYEIDDLLKLYRTLSCSDVIEADAMSHAARYITGHALADCAAASIEAHVKGLMRVDRYGLKEADFCVTSFAVVKTYRFMTGEPRAWGGGAALDTTACDQPSVSSGPR